MQRRVGSTDVRLLFLDHRERTRDDDGNGLDVGLLEDGLACHHFLGALRVEGVVVSFAVCAFDVDVWTNFGRRIECKKRDRKS